MQVSSLQELPLGEMKVVKAGKTEILLIHHEGGIAGVQPKCPHAGAPLKEGAVCNSRLVCPWHLGTFALPSGDLLEPPAMEPLKTYAVRLEGQNILVDADPLPPTRMPARQTSQTPVFLLVGAGAAGAMAASTLRQEGFCGKIIVVDPVPDEPVDRTQLSKQSLSGEIPFEKIAIDTFSCMEAERITASVIKLSAATGTADLSTGISIKFDKALVATGGKPKRLDIPGAQLAHTIRHPDDVRKILAATQNSKGVVIIGTSFIALEAASALVQKGLKVTVVGREKLPFEKQFGRDAAIALKKLHEDNGTRFQLGVEITRISPDGVAILGVGVSPELDFEHDLSLSTGTNLRVSENVWIAGDIASVDGTRIEHWRVAQQHGRVAALGMLGKIVKYQGVPFFWTYHFGKRLGYLGHAEAWDKTFLCGNLEDMKFILFYLKEGHVKAVLNCEFESQTALLAELMRNPLSLDDALRAIG